MREVNSASAAPKPATRTRWRLLAFGALVATLLSAHLIAHRWLGGWSSVVYHARLLYLERVPPMAWPVTEFTPEAWAATPPQERYRFAKSLIGSGRLLRLTSSQVANLLGGATPDDQAVYPLRPAGVQNLWWVMVVEFQNGQAASVRRGMAWLDP